MGGKSLGEIVGVQARFLCREQVWLEGRKEGEHQGGRQEARYRLLCGEMAEAPDVPWGGAREGERNRVPGTWRQWRW